MVEGQEALSPERGLVTVTDSWTVPSSRISGSSPLRPKVLIPDIKRWSQLGLKVRDIGDLLITGPASKDTELARERRSDTGG